MVEKKTVILLSGKKSTGKDTTAHIIADMFKCKSCGGTGFNGGARFAYDSWGNEVGPCMDCKSGRKVVKMSFAAPLKQLCINTFGLGKRQCYGESGERETPSPIRWRDISPKYHTLKPDGASADDFLSAREILQFVGTNVMRDFYPNVWARAAGLSALRSYADIVVYTDARFPNEIEEFQEMALNGEINLVVVRMRRDTGIVDDHPSETALDAWDEEMLFEETIFNNGSIEELQKMVKALMIRRGIIND